jgi:hypothetical protein
VVEVPRHIANEGGVDDLKTSVVLPQSKHVAAEVELLLSDIGHGLTDDLPDVLGHNSALLGEIANEKAKPVDL